MEFALSLSNDTFLPWCIFRDFDDLLSNDEKMGLIDNPSWLIHRFRETTSDNNLYDLPMKGHQYTWTKQRVKHDNVEERLDKWFATFDWLDIFPKFKLSNGVVAKSNHSLILLQLDASKKVSFCKKIRFENSWLLELELNDVIHHG